jgi:hypothetical protein
MFLLAAVLVAGVFTTGAAVAVATSSTPATAAIHACRSAKTGELFLWGACPKGYTGYSWAVTGPAGPRGPAGPGGFTGATGPAGPSFADPFTLTFGGTSVGPAWVAYTCSVSATAADGSITGVVCLNRVYVVNRAVRSTR